MSDPKVAVFMPSLDGGGAERVALTLAAGFAERGYAVELVATSGHGELRGEIPENVDFVDLEAPRMLRSLLPLVRYLRRARPTHVLSVLTPANCLIIWARAIAGVPAKVVISEHGMVMEHALFGRSLPLRLLPCLVRLSHPFADGIVAVSHGLARELSEFINRVPTINTVYNPVYTESLLRKMAESSDHPWFRDGAPPVVLAVGRLAPEKGYPTLLHAFARLQRTHLARLMILGEGPERTRLEALATKLGIADEIAIPGFVANPYTYMKRAAVYALPSRYEGFGMALVEAMACETPVVSTDCLHGPREILEDGRHGILVPVDDSDTLARALARQLDSPYRATLKQRANDFTVEACVRGYLRALGLEELEDCPAAARTPYSA